MQDLSVRIASRSDTLANWTSQNPVLLNGEIAIVFDNSNQLFKVGDGIHHFEDLPFAFYDQFASKQMNTDLLKAKSINQGYASEVNGIGGIATGYKSQVSSNFAQAHGHQANVSSDFGYVWNGDNSTSTYIDHGAGTYNINPRGGLNGFYIGEYSISNLLSAKQDKLQQLESNVEYVAYVQKDGQTARSNIQLSSLEIATANVRSTYFVELNSPLVYGSLFPVKYKDIDPYDGYWEFYQTYERRVGLFNGTVDLIEVKSDDPALNGRLCCYLKSSPSSQFQIEGDILSAENLTWSEFESSKRHEFTFLGESCVIELKTYYDANGYSRASVDKLFAEKTQLSDYYKKNETSSAVELNSEFKKQSSVQLISNDTTFSKDLSVIKLSADEYSELIANENANPSALYVVENDFVNAYGEQIKNLAEPELSSDAATKNYVDSEIAKIPQPDLSEFMKLSSESTQDISSNLSIDGCLSVRNLVVQDSSVGAAKWGSVEGNVEDQTDLVKVNYPLDNPTVSSEIVDDVTYKRFDIKDHTIATISLSDATPVRIHFPDKPTENFCRDFIVKIKVTSDSIPQVQFVKGQNDTSIGFEYEDDSWATLEVGINYFTFTETERE